MKVLLKILYVVIWWIYTFFIMALFPIYLIGWPMDWAICKVHNLVYKGANYKTSTWWWDFGDWIETWLPA